LRYAEDSKQGFESRARSSRSVVRGSTVDSGEAGGREGTADVRAGDEEEDDGVEDGLDETRVFGEAVELFDPEGIEAECDGEEGGSSGEEDGEEDDGGGSLVEPVTMLVRVPKREESMPGSRGWRGEGFEERLERGSKGIEAGRGCS
jgi:hypothetical protein